MKSYQLTENQKKILKLLQQGWIIEESLVAVVPCKIKKRGLPKYHRNVSVSTYNKFLDAGIINKMQLNSCLFEAAITDYGKTLLYK